MKLYIGNLSYDTTEVSLRDALAEFGPIKDLYLPVDQATGRLRGFAFVVTPNRAAGESAIARLDGTDLNGRKLRVNEARERV